MPDNISAANDYILLHPPTVGTGTAPGQMPNPDHILLTSSEQEERMGLAPTIDKAYKELVGKLTPSASRGKKRVPLVPEDFLPFLGLVARGSVPTTYVATLGDYLQQNGTDEDHAAVGTAVCATLGPVLLERLRMLSKIAAEPERIAAVPIRKGGGSLAITIGNHEEFVRSFLMGNYVPNPTIAETHLRAHVASNALHRLLCGLLLGACVVCGRDDKMSIISFGRREYLPRRLYVPPPGWPDNATRGPMSLCRGCRHACEECDFSLAKDAGADLAALLANAESIRNTGECVGCGVLNPVLLPTPKPNPKEMQRLRLGLRGLRKEGEEEGN